MINLLLKLIEYINNNMKLTSTEFYNLVSMGKVLQSAINTATDGPLPTFFSNYYYDYYLPIYSSIKSVKDKTT